MGVGRGGASPSLFMVIQRAGLHVSVAISSCSYIARSRERQSLLESRLCASIQNVCNVHLHLSKLVKVSLCNWQ